MKSRPVIIALIAGQLIVFVAAWRQTDPATTDFPAFFFAAKAWQRGANPYDLDEQCRPQEKVRPAYCLPFAHPPLVLPAVSLVSSDDFAASYRRWCVLLVAVCALCLLPLYGLTRDALISAQTLLFVPVFIGVALAQDTAFVLLGVLLWAWLMALRRDFSAGLALALVCVKPQLAIPLAVPLLFSRPRAFLGFCAGGGVLTLVSFALVGAEGFRGLLDITRLMAEGRGYGISPERMFSAAGLFARAGLSPLWSWLTFACAVALISWLWRRAGTSSPALALGTLLAVFASPHLHRHDLSLLALPIALIHPMAPLLSTLALLFSFALGYEHAGAYALMLALAYGLARSVQAPDGERQS